MMSKDNIRGAKTVFVFDQPSSPSSQSSSQGDQDQKTSLLCSVEEYVREHYKALGYTQGLHGEGAVVNTLAAILFWDVIYDISLPDVFR